jgi:hypothetical protein
MTPAENPSATANVRGFLLPGAKANVAPSIVLIPARRASEKAMMSVELITICRAL